MNRNHEKEVSTTASAGGPNTQLPTNEGTLIIVFQSPHRGRHISSSQRELWVHVTKLKLSSRSERHNRTWVITLGKIYVAPPGLSFRMVASNPQLALWATNISLASPTGRPSTLTNAIRFAL